VITILHNGWSVMPKPIELDLLLNGNIPERIKKLMANRKMKCSVSGKTIDIANGASVSNWKPSADDLMWPLIRGYLA